MFGTLISVVIAGLVFFYPHLGEVSLWFMPAVALGLFLVFFLGTIVALLPLQAAERDTTPQLVQMFQKDRSVKFVSNWATVFLIVSFGFNFSSLLRHQFLIPIWVILLGVTVDLLFYYARLITSYLDPVSVLDLFMQQAKKSIGNKDDEGLCLSIDSLSEVAVKAIKRHSSSTCTVVLNRELEIARLFLLFSKNAASPDINKKPVIEDRVTYIMLYLYQRVDMILGKALENQLEAVCLVVISILGKLALSAALYDVSMASAPLRFLGKCAKRCQDKGMEEVPVAASCMLYEVAKMIIADVDLRYYVLVDTFLSIINGMEVVTKGAFQRNKGMDIQLLMQPFLDLKKLLDDPKIKGHKDHAVILFNVDRVLGEFEALKMVMITMPKIEV